MCEYVYIYIYRKERETNQALARMNLRVDTGNDKGRTTQEPHTENWE